MEGRDELDVRVQTGGALQRQDQGDPAVGERGVDVVAVQAQPYLVRVALGQGVRALDHPQRLAQRALGAEPVVDEDRQHLQIHPALAQLGQPALPEETRPAAWRARGDRDQQIVVRVGDDGAAVEFTAHAHALPSVSSAAAIVS